MKYAVLTDGKILKDIYFYFFQKGFQYHQMREDKFWFYETLKETYIRYVLLRLYYLYKVSIKCTLPILSIKYTTCFRWASCKEKCRYLIKSKARSTVEKTHIITLMQTKSHFLPVIALNPSITNEITKVEPLNWRLQLYEEYRYLSFLMLRLIESRVEFMLGVVVT